MVKPSETPNTAPKASKLSLAGAATSIIFVATKDVFCRDKHMFKLVFVATKIILVAAPANNTKQR